MMSTWHSVENFAARFCNELDSSKNVIFSPLSAETLLALVALGSRDHTRAELLTALNMPDDRALRSTFKTLTETLDLSSGNSALSFITSIFKTSNKRDVILKIANKIYLKQGGTLKPEVIKDAEKIFKSSFEQINFKESTAAANMINDWVSKQTKNVIKDVVSPDMLNEDTSLVLVNAIYFHGFWEIPFSTHKTQPRDFLVNNITKINLDMMSLEGPDFDYRHCPELKAKILQMFYKWGEASMVMILPDEIEGLSDVMKRLTAGYNLKENIKTLKKKPLQVVIPKFKVETEIDLKKLLPKMGVQSIFDDSKSDINLLTSNDRLYVSEAIQKAYIVVDEKGTEAAAVTNFNCQIERCGFRWKGETFVADRPYLYLLTARGIPIFYGIFRGN